MLGDRYVGNGERVLRFERIVEWMMILLGVDLTNYLIYL
jgi:hypothetical protein